MTMRDGTARRRLCGGPHDGAERHLPAAVEVLHAHEPAVLHGADGSAETVMLPGAYVLVPGTSTMAWIEIHAPVDGRAADG